MKTDGGVQKYLFFFDCELVERLDLSSEIFFFNSIILFVTNEPLLQVQQYNRIEKKKTTQSRVRRYWVFLLIVLALIHFCVSNKIGFYSSFTRFYFKVFFLWFVSIILDCWFLKLNRTKLMLLVLPRFVSIILDCSSWRTSKKIWVDVKIL